MKARGFTLIEMLVVITILAILASIAVPAYDNFLTRTRRVEGKTALLEASQGLERCFTRFAAYNAAGCDTATAVAATFTSESAWYLIGGQVNPTTYTLVATPQGGQADDTECGNFGLNEVGVKTITGTGTIRDCWVR